MSETLIALLVDGLFQLVKDLEGAPTQASIETAVRDAMVKASDIAIAAEFPNEKP